MLELKNIKKDYLTGENRVEALKGIDIEFRKNEFVSVLGQSGCGKTTLLNIIGGLDKYNDGDLIINGKSTREFSDRDWDAYRNHSIGFVFQSYNLIPHQSVLQNVELALTLSGVGKSERRKRAQKALEDVGLGDQLKKKPNEMSGGQMQRVAIARALVNNPDIILADEPTGALDTETSVQIMEILKNISKERLIIMVTHNPELAEQYSSRIVRMLDGKIIDDSMPLTKQEKESLNSQEDVGDNKKDKKVKMPSMSFATSFMLSLKNLFTKKGRTTLTAFAGSIGIIGIALILAISQGMTVYIDDVQESTLSSYPLTIEDTTVELTDLMQTFMNITTEKTKHKKDAVYKKSALYDIVNAMNSLEEQENDLKSFKKFLTKEITYENSDLYTAVNGVQYSYDLDMLVYTKNIDGNIIRSHTEEILTELMAKYMKIDMSAMTSMAQMNSSSPFGSMSTMKSGLWQELLPGNDGAPINDLILNQYDLIYGSWPNSYDEILLVVDQNNELDDVTLYALGLLPEENMKDLINASVDGSKLDVKEMKWSFEEICKSEYKTILNADCYKYDEATGLYTDLRDTTAGLRYLYDNALSLKVTGIIRPSEDSDTKMISGSICYTNMLTEHLIKKAQDSITIKAQLESTDVDILTGLPFKSTTGSLEAEQKANDFKSYINSLDDNKKAEMYLNIKSIPSKEYLDTQVSTAMSRFTREDIEKNISEGYATQMNVSREEIDEYLSSMTDDELNEIFTGIITEQIKAQYAEAVKTQMSSLQKEQLVLMLNADLIKFSNEECAVYYDELMTFSESTYEDNLIKMGYIDIESPSAINIYASSFENKDIITEAIEDYNKNVDEIKKIKYTDYMGILMSSITTIINAITYVLIAFVAISLIVSSIMIGVITLISVQERTKEIGILRAIGASKKDVSGMFNAETVIVGFAAGLIGVGVTYLLCIPINIIIHKITGIVNLDAVLPIPAAIILVLISVVLTLISGLIPSRSAAKKDPVVALRTE